LAQLLIMPIGADAGPPAATYIMNSIAAGAQQAS